MTRGLTTAQKSYLDDNAVIHETLIQISYDGNSVFYTSGLADVSGISTSYSGGTQTWVATNNIQNIDTIVEKTFGITAPQALLFTGDMSVTLGALGVSALDLPNIDTNFYIHRIFRNVSTYTVWGEDPIELFAGILIKKTYTVGIDTELLQLDLQNKSRFYNKVSQLKILKGLGVL